MGTASIDFLETKKRGMGEAERTTGGSTLLVWLKRTR